MAAEPIRREAEGTKKKDARDIGIGAGAGAVIGGIIGGGKGAGIGAAVGGAGGAGKVLATKGEEVTAAVGHDRDDAPRFAAGRRDAARAPGRHRRLMAGHTTLAAAIAPSPGCSW